MTFTKEEKDYLFSKLEYTKKKRIEATKNDIYKMLKGGASIDEEGLINILNSLEYSFKKKLKTGTMNSEVFKSIQKKLPSSWMGVSYSNISSHKKKAERKPKLTNTKKEIMDFLKKKSIKHDDSMTKTELLKLIKENARVINSFSIYNIING